MVKKNYCVSYNKGNGKIEAEYYEGLTAPPPDMPGWKTLQVKEVSNREECFAVHFGNVNLFIGSRAPMSHVSIYVGYDWEKIVPPWHRPDDSPPTPPLPDQKPEGQNSKK